MSFLGNVLSSFWNIIRHGSEWKGPQSVVMAAPGLFGLGMTWRETNLSRILQPVRSCSLSVTASGLESRSDWLSSGVSSETVYTWRVSHGKGRVILLRVLSILCRTATLCCWWSVVHSYIHACISTHLPTYPPTHNLFIHPYINIHSHLLIHYHLSIHSSAHPFIYPPPMCLSTYLSINSSTIIYPFTRLSIIYLAI